MDRNGHKQKETEINGHKWKEKTVMDRNEQMRTETENDRS